MNVYCKKIIEYIVSLALCFAFSNSYSQTSKTRIDSLKVALNQQRSDSQKINILIDLTSEISCTDSLSKIYYANGAKELADKTEWTIGRIKTNIAIGNLYSTCLKNYPKAIKYFLTADSLAKSVDDKAYQISSLNSIAFFYQKTGQYSHAIECYRQALTLHPDYDIQMGIWGNLGVEYNSIGDYNMAVSSYYSSLKVLDLLQRTKKNGDAQDTIQMAVLLLNIGDIYLSMKRPDQAFENYDSVYKIGIKINNTRLQTMGLMSIGKTYQIKNNFDQSIAKYQMALANSVTWKDFEDEVQIYNELANSYLGKGDLVNAMQNAQSSLKLAEEKANNEELPKAYITLGKVYLQQKVYGNAVDYLQKALTISQKNGTLDDEKETWAALSSTYEQMNQPAKAFDAYRHFITIRDSVYNIAKANEFTRQELDYSYKNKELADKLAYDKKIAEQQLYTYCGFGGLVLVLLLAFFVYRNYNTQKKYNELLSREQQRHLAHIEAQDTVLTDIAHIQSHQVRGPVATILGLVQIFNYDDPTDPVNKEVMEGLGVVTEKLDTVVKEVILKENKLKRDQKEGPLPGPLQGRG